ncbi:phosphoglycolate phosphatase [Nitratifractor sp.]
MNGWKKELILFDLDGTLIDSVPDLADAVNLMLEELGREPFPEATIRGWVGNGAATLVRRALSGSHEPDPAVEPLFEEARQRFLEHYGSRIPGRTLLYPGVRETLERLEERGYRMAIVTNKPEPFVAPILEGLGIAGPFELIVGGETLPVKKPDPLPLLHSCERLGVAPDDAVMVGDSRNDILAARAAGIDSVAVSYGYNYDEPIESYEPKVVLKRFEELLEHFPERREG